MGEYAGIIRFHHIAHEENEDKSENSHGDREERGAIKLTENQNHYL
jgi:hypothetical protein